MIALQKFTDEQLLFELITRNAIGSLPSKAEYSGENWRQCHVGIDCGNTATVLFTKEAFESLAMYARVHTMKQDT